jgi:hypothetical protein
MFLYDSAIAIEANSHRAALLAAADNHRIAKLARAGRRAARAAARRGTRVTMAPTEPAVPRPGPIDRSAQGVHAERNDDANSRYAVPR